MMTEREKILGRIREALTLSAPRPGAHGTAHAKPHSIAAAIPGLKRPVVQAKAWLPLGGDTFEQQVERFQIASTELKSDFRLLNSQEELLATLRALRSEWSWKKMAFHRAPLCDAARAALGGTSLCTDGGYDVNELESCDVGITECDALVAQTGTVLVTTRSAGGRALSVLPPHHVVLARRSQMVPDLYEAFALLKERYGADYPSMMSLITGPSRTGDIERILVLGAHGPKNLTILCV